MYFYASDLDQAPFGWVKGFCERGGYYETAYKWLAQYSNFFPPIFLSSDQSKLSGYSLSCDKILFGFKNITGFPVKYDEWIKIVGILINLDTNNFRLIDERLLEGLSELSKLGEIQFNHSANLDSYLNSKVFVNYDQIVVSSLDLRKSCVIVCFNEIQKSALVRK
jgi:hypothetical protein